jgi:hypothetical protein
MISSTLSVADGEGRRNLVLVRSVHVSLYRLSEFNNLM